MYEYKMIQIPPAINVGQKDKGNEAATYLSNVVNEFAVEGWEFQRVDSIGVNVTPGCSSGKNETFHTYYVITFRRQK